MTAKLAITSGDRNSNGSSNYNITEEQPQPRSASVQPQIVVPKVIKKQQITAAANTLPPASAAAVTVVRPAVTTTTTCAATTTSTSPVAEAASTPINQGQSTNGQHKLAIEVNIPSSRRFSFSCEGRRVGSILSIIYLNSMSRKWISIFHDFVKVLFKKNLIIKHDTYS